MNVEKWLNPALENMKAYQVPTLPEHAVKIDAMEMPLDFTPAIKLQWRAGVLDVALNRYPLAKNDRLEQLLRQRFDISERHALMIGNGSDELIQIILMSMRHEGAVVMAPVPTFVMYEHVSHILGMKFVGVPLDASDFTMNLDAMLSNIIAHQPAVIFLANPNNPTGNLFDVNAIDAIIQATEGLVVIDEAYLPFVTAEQWHAYEQYDNVVVIRTLSKMGLAGLRFGYMFGPEHWLREFDKVRPPYNVNVLTQYSVEFALEHLHSLQKKINEIIDERARLQAKLAANTALTVYPSQANFLVVRAKNGQEIYRQLQENNVWVKNLHAMHPMLANCLRVTVSNREENNLFMRSLDDIVNR